MRNLSITFVFLLQLSSIFVFAQVAGNEINMFGETSIRKKKEGTPKAYLFDDKIAININSLYNAKADKFVAIFNINQIGKTASEANELINNRINGVINDLVAKNITKEQIYVDMLTFVPEYEYEVEKKIFSKTYTEVPKGFRLQKNIHITYSNSKTINELVNACAKHEIYDLVKVNYYSENIKEIYDTLRIASIELIKEKIKSYEGLGIKLDNVFKLVAEDKFVKYPNDRYSSYTAFNSSSIDVIKKRNNIKKRNKTKTYYYDPISAYSYDIVINPIINEPVIQYAINMKFRLDIVKETGKIEKAYFIISKDGVLKKIDLN
ncbi:MAG: hypothetical protein B6I20_10370 [Bacteroidetes bacterium 4572_117]|nr:MAG: hypothetical protein B6I20_10370 [Bacteroidetes bacterium 4572_117]